MILSRAQAACWLAILFCVVAVACDPSKSAEEERSEQPISIPFGVMPSVTAAHDDFLYVGDRRGNAIAKIDPSSNEVVLERPLSDLVEERHWTIWDLDAAGDSLWATIPSAKRVLQLDAESLDLERVIEMDGHVADLFPTGDGLWFAGGRGGVQLFRMDAGSGEIEQVSRLGPRNTHLTDVVEHDGSIWLVTDHARYIDGEGPTPTFEVSAELWELDPETGRVVDKLSLGSTFARGAVNPVVGDVEATEEGLWMSRVHERRLVLVDPSDAEVLLQFYVAIFEHPWHFKELEDDLWIGELNGPRVAHIDTETRARTLLTLDSETSHLGTGAGSVWVPLMASPDGGSVVGLDRTLVD